MVGSYGMERIMLTRARPGKPYRGLVLFAA